jgi:hypothetical protein
LATENLVGHLANGDPRITWIVRFTVMLAGVLLVLGAYNYDSHLEPRHDIDYDELIVLTFGSYIATAISLGFLLRAFSLRRAGMPITILLLALPAVSLLGFALAATGHFLVADLVSVFTAVCVLFVGLVFGAVLAGLTIGILTIMREVGLYNSGFDVSQRVEIASVLLALVMLCMAILVAVLRFRRSSVRDLS